MMTEIFFLLVTIILSFFLKFLYATTRDSDMWDNLWRVQLLSRNRFGFCRIDDALVGKYQGYPSLPLYIISRFPKKYWLFTGKILNIVYDCLILVLVYFVSFVLFRKIWKLDSNSFISAEIAITFLCATSPILFPATARLRSLGGRTLGNLLNVSYFICFGYAFLFNKPLLYMPCLIIGILIILSSQFGVQNWIFTSIVISLMYLNPLPLIFIIIIFSIGLIIPGLGIKEIFLLICNTYLWYFAFRKGTTAEGRNSIKDIACLPIYLVKEPRKFFNLIFEKITPLIAAYSVPALVLLIFWAVKFSGTIAFLAQEKYSFYFLALIVSSLCAFIITSIEPFLFLGEAERYFEYSVFYINLLFVYYILKKGTGLAIVFWLLIMQLIVVIIIYIYSKRTDFIKALSLDEDKMFAALVDFLKKQNELRIISIPVKISSKIALYLDNPNAKFYYQFVSDKVDGFQYMRDEMKIYQFVMPEFKYFQKKYNINTIIVQKSALIDAQKAEIVYPFDTLQRLFENDEYAVYRIDNP